jgi:A/G-specific adenine glycosylase
VADSDFAKAILEWYHTHKRAMPWRDNPEAYRVWISEIMLQQTRVDQATPYFNRFIERFPDIQALAEADQQDVLKVWEGLGYYSRARNLHETAKRIWTEFGGRFPESYEQILDLKGVGPYTAAAISSIVFNLPHAVVDGNVIRLITRYAGIREDVRSQKVKNQVQELADEWLSKEHPGDFNQAMMEMGAMICTPRKPDCPSCPLQLNCVAYQTVQTDSIPYKSPPKKKPHHHIAVGILQRDDEKVLIALRPEDAMLGGLWEFPGGKQEENEDIEYTLKRELKEELDVETEIIRPFMNLKHTYSHFSITLHAFLCRIKSGEPKPKDSQEIRWVARNELSDYPFPKANKTLTEKLMDDNQKNLEI